MKSVAQEVLNEHISKRLLIVAGVVAFVLIEARLGMAVANSEWTYILLPLGALVLVMLIRIDPFILMPTWLLLGFPLRSWGGFSIGFGLPSITVDRFFLGVCFLIVGTQVLLRKRRLVQLGPADISLLVFFVFSLLSLLLQVRDLRQEGLNYLVSVVLPLLAYFLARNLIRTENEVRQIVWVLRVVALVISLWTLAELALGFSIFTGEQLSTVSGRPDIVRASSGIGHPSATGTALVMLLPFVLHSLAHERRRAMKLLALVEVAVLGLAVYVTFIRAVWIVFLLVFMVLFLTYPRLRRLTATTLLVGALGSVIFWSTISESPVFVYKVADAANLYGRWDAAEVQWAVFLTSPITGIGGSAPALIDSIGGSSHNTYLNFLSQFGLLGIIPYVLPIVIAFRRSWRAFRRLPGDRFLGSGLVACLGCTMLAYIINAMSVDLYFMAILTGTFLIALAMILQIEEIAGASSIRHEAQSGEGRKWSE